MAKTTPMIQIPAQLRPVLHAAAKNLLFHLYGSQGLPWGTSFADLEELVVQLAETFSSELLQQALQHQAEQPLPPPLQHCPRCGRSTQPGEPQPRTVQTRRGTADWHEPSSSCDHCRKAFFPSVQEPGDRPG